MKNVLKHRMSIRLAVVLCGCLVLTVTTAWAQRASISLPDSEITLGELFAQIKRQTGQTVIFSPESATQSRRVTLTATRGTVAEILAATLPGQGLGWKMVENYIVIGPARPVVEDNPAPKLAQTPILINAAELKTFVAEAERAPDSVYLRTVARGPFEFKADNKVFALPGTVVSSHSSQRRLSGFAIKTNLLHGAVGLAPNIYGEAGLGRRTTIEAGFARNGWNRNGTVGDNRKMIHGGVTGEFRYWMCERFDGHFFGVHAFWRFYNVGGHNVPLVAFKRDFRYEGTAIGGGVTYGYALVLAPRWNLEFNLGVGLAHMEYEKFGCDKCDDRVDTIDKTYFLPTRAGVTLSFVIQ